MERTRKFKEGRYLIITTKLHLYQAQQEADHLLRKYFPKMKNTTTNNSRPSRVSPKIKHNHFSNYAAALSQSVNEPVENRYSYPHCLNDDQYPYPSQPTNNMPLTLPPLKSENASMIHHQLQLFRQQTRKQQQNLQRSNLQLVPTKLLPRHGKVRYLK